MHVEDNIHDVTPKCEVEKLTEGGDELRFKELLSLLNKIFISK